jgi:hypothetical protein
VKWIFSFLLGFIALLTNAVLLLQPDWSLYGILVFVSINLVFYWFSRIIKTAYSAEDKPVKKKKLTQLIVPFFYLLSIGYLYIGVEIIQADSVQPLSNDAWHHHKSIVFHSILVLMGDLLGYEVAGAFVMAVGIWLAYMAFNRK